MAWFSFEELAADGVAGEFAVFDGDFSADGDDVGAAFDGPAFEGAVVDVLALGFGGDGAAVGGVEEDEVGVRADGDGAFAGEEAEEFGGVGAGGFDEAVEGNFSFGDAVGVEEVDAVFDRGDAVGNFGEVIAAHEFLGGEVEWGVVGGDGGDESGGEAAPEDFLVFLVAEGRAHDIFGAFEAVVAGEFGVGFIEEEVLDEGFDGDFDTAEFGGNGDFEGFLAGEVDDVDVGVVHGGEGHEVVGTFGFDERRAGFVVEGGAGVAGGEEFFLAFGDGGIIFAVGGGDDAELFGEFEGVVEFGVVYAEEAFVGEEDFEGGDAGVDDFAELAFGFGIVAGDAHVEGEVAGAFSFGLGFPEVEGFERVIHAAGAAHFDEGGGASDEGGLAGAGVVILGEGAHEGEVDVGVGVDETGEDEFAHGVDGFGAGRGLKGFADFGDGFVFAVDVGDVAVGRGDDFPVPDEQRHGVMPQ